jgi:1-aminocyclopropane-1-carboxylate deaminase/D-cysteine desulfhydrase-like pyridoxal-dependent ACC family enzyme
VAEDYQNFIPAHPRVRLATLPTPLERADRLEAALRDEGVARVPPILLKRDDVLSLGGGGNKVRSLEFSIGQALAAGATDVVTAGRQQSNHCRLTAAACARVGLRAHLALTGSAPEAYTGNLLLDRLFGAKIYFTGSDDRAARAQCVAKIVEDVRAAGAVPYEIPVGGSDARGAVGHMLLAKEIVEQCEARRIDVSTIVLASATGGTQAGLLCGLRKLGRGIAVHAFTVAWPAAELRDAVTRIASELVRDAGAPAVISDDVIIDEGELGAGYGKETDASRAAMAMLARTEGVVADPVYTSKAMAGLLALVREGRLRGESAVVFVHTGGSPALFA